MMQKKIYLAGGCFWGMQALYSQIEGVINTEVGYANGFVENPTYEMVCSDTTGFVEVLCIVYDREIVCLNMLLDYFFYVIDPCSLNKQGEDEGSQYRTGIYFTNSEDEELIRNYIEDISYNYEGEIVTEVLPLENYYPAEEYHQNYLEKNPDGYCHINLDVLNHD